MTPITREWLEQCGFSEHPDDHLIWEKTFNVARSIRVTWNPHIVEMRNGGGGQRLYIEPSVERLRSAWHALTGERLPEPADSDTIGIALDAIEESEWSHVVPEIRRRLEWPTKYPLLYGRHFALAAEWDDAEKCLAWASENEATVNEMRAWRRAMRGEDLCEPGPMPDSDNLIPARFLRR